MKKFRYITLIMGLVLLCGCGKPAGNSKITSENSVKNTIDEQISGDSNQADKTEDAKAASSAKSSTPATAEVDVDLTEMGSDMVYATVYQMMIEPDNYVGQTVRMSGSYYSSLYEDTGKYYNFVIINDATACCSQGIEFIWGDGSHTYPDEYPAEETAVEVTGVFETYTEEGDEQVYCRLKDATLTEL